MMNILSGIDEAGLGPMLGPLVIACCGSESENLEEITGEITKLNKNINDSKKVYTGKSIKKLEEIALSGIEWQTGIKPETAADFLALCGENEEKRTLPWMQGAKDIKLPISKAEIINWKNHLPKASCFSADIIHPKTLNENVKKSINRSDSEWHSIAKMLKNIFTKDSNSNTLIDRLGGRAYYNEIIIKDTNEPSEIINESKGISEYKIQKNNLSHDISFCVKGESKSIMCALSSCIAKYTRELHMKLFNNYWVSKGIKSTAGYPQDAAIWKKELENTNINVDWEELWRFSHFN